MFYLKKQLSKVLLVAAMVCSGQYLLAQDMDYARSVVKTLASPGYKGRGYFGDGAAKASEFIAAAFKKAGLLPLNAGSYYQSFKLSVNTFPGKVDVALNGAKLITAKDYLVDASSPASSGTFKVYTLLRADLANTTKVVAALKQAGENFLLIDNRKVSVESAKEQSAIAQNQEALKRDPNLKLKGLILYSNDKLTWTTLTEQGPRIILQLNKPDLEPAILNKIELEVDARLVPEYTTRNVAGMIKGSSGTDSTVVITAHFDHLGMLGENVYFPGANDNASGVSMMLSFVKQFSKKQPKYNTLFLAFSGEEIGLLGSKAFIEAPLIDLKKIKFLVNFDLAGTGEEGIKVVNATIHKAEFQRLVNLNEEYKLLKKVEPRGPACNSDHCWFHEQDVPSFFIYTQGGISAYHDIYDRAETLPLTAFQSFFRLMDKFFEEL
jgi:aminopeptidase YwaD